MNLTPIANSKKTACYRWVVLCLLFLTLSAINAKSLAQELLIKQPFMEADTVHKPNLHLQPEKKRLGRAAIELGIAELTPWTIDKYIRKVDYTSITWQTTARNLKLRNWAWDNDNFQTNQFGHPYHGSFYFSTMRTNGYNFWQSVPAAFLGSYLWETFAENQAPAPNDFINTSFGGIILGETTYRLSNMIVNNHSRGFKHQLTEVAGLLVNPVNGLNRLLDGKWGRVRHGRQVTDPVVVESDSSKISAIFDVGIRKLNENLGGSLRGHIGWYTRASFLYGTPYERFKEPFSNITVTAELGRDDSTMLNVVSVYGSLTGWQLKTKPNQKQLLTLSANYDYIHNVAFFYGGQSVKLNLYSEYGLTRKVKFNTLFGAGPVILAAVPDNYIIYNGRNYDYGSGFALNGGGRISIANRLDLSGNYRGGWMVTLNGNPSHYFLHAVSGEVSYRFIKNFALNGEAGYFALKGNYNNFPDVNKSYPYLRMSVRYTLNP